MNVVSWILDLLGLNLLERNTSVMVTRYGSGWIGVWLIVSGC